MNPVTKLLIPLMPISVLLNLMGQMEDMPTRVLGIKKVPAVAAAVIGAAHRIIQTACFLQQLIRMPAVAVAAVIIIPIFPTSLNLPVRVPETVTRR